MTKKYEVAVVGGGSAGVMSALRVVLNNDSCVLFPGTPKDRKRSRAMWVKKVENIPAHLGYDRGIERPNKETLDWIAQSKFKDNLEVLKNTGVTDIVKEGDEFRITDSKGEEHLAQYVVLATGVMDVQPKIGGVIDDILPFANHQSADYCLRCDGHHVLDQELAVIGHDEGAAWTAIILFERYRNPNVTILTHGKDPEWSEETDKIVKGYKFDIKKEEIEQVMGDSRTGKLDGFTLCCGSNIYCQIVFVSLGMLVYNDLAKKLGAELDQRGFVVTDEKCESSIHGLYVAGDLRANTRKQIYDAWATAVSAADAINGRLRAARRSKEIGI